jgi:hypothetical protein
MGALRFRHARFRRTVGVLAAVVCALTSADASAAPGPFAPDSVWTAPLSRKAPAVPGSAAMVAELKRQTTLPGGVWIDTTEWSFPVYTVPADQPLVRVKLDIWNPKLEADFRAVPLPPDAKPARQGDAHLSLHQPATDTLWEFWGLTKQADGWHARWGGKMTSASKNPGYFTDGYGATATGLPLVGGLIRRDEMAAGVIDHALAFDIPAPEARRFVWPANRTDGNALASAASIPEGTRFRLDPSLDIGSLKLPKGAAAMARAAQKYGMVVIDRASSVTFKAEDPARFGTNPWPGLFGTPWPNVMLKDFPWSRLQVVVPTRAAFDGGAPPPVTPPPVVTPPVKPAVVTPPVKPPGAAPAKPSPAKTSKPRKPAKPRKSHRPRKRVKRGHRRQR